MLWWGFFPPPFLLLVLKKEILCQHQRYMVPSQYQAVYPERKERTIRPSLEAMSILPLQETSPSTDFPNIKS